MRYGFVIDNRKCIGCHACTTACKSENEVPLGVFRTWVKYTEKGSFPNTRRYFNVTRCNHCDNAPCITVCPTKALYRRPDGIVDFDSSRCIGCKSCMQACPYDALYIDPFEHTAAKCNYCAHRVDLGLLPACVIVCPEKAIVAGDLDDPSSEIAHLVATEPVLVRKPEQGTRPKLFYIDADEASLTPEAQTRQGAYLWGQVRPDDRPALATTADDDLAPAGDGVARIAYDIHHPKPWGWKVTTYLWTKSIGAGVALVAAILWLIGAVGDHATFAVAAPVLAVLFIVATSVLLVSDLKRPERFWFLLAKPNPRSWLVIGGYILGLFGAVAFLWLLAAVGGFDLATKILMGIGIPLALATAGYTAFLFAQAEGRDFWQSRLLLPSLIAQAIVAGTATLIIFGVTLGAGSHELRVLAGVLGAGVLVFAALLAAELTGAHVNAHVARTVRLLREGPYRMTLLLAVVLLGVVVPLVLAAAALLPGLTVLAAAFAASAALAGLWFWERIWVSAGQDVPLS